MSPHSFIAAVLLLSIGASGCSTLMHGADFVVSGEVKSAQTGEPVPAATIKIVDHGLDYARKRSATHLIAQESADENGVFTLRFYYSWCTKGIFLADGADGAIGVVADADGFRPMELVVKCVDEDYQDGAFRLVVEDIALVAD